MIFRLTCWCDPDKYRDAICAVHIYSSFGFLKDITYIVSVLCITIFNSSYNENKEFFRFNFNNNISFSMRD
jgi:hypothetical protein